MADIGKRPFNDAACIAECLDEAYLAFVRDVLTPLTATVALSDNARYDLGRALKAAITRAYDALATGAEAYDVAEALFSAARRADELRKPTEALPVLRVATEPLVRSLG